MREAGSPSDPPRSTSQIVLRNTLFSLGAQAALRAASFLFNIYVIRTLGGEQFGQYQIVLDWAGLFAVIGDLGISQYLAREIARDRNKTTEVFWDTVALRLILSIMAALITVAAAAGITDYSVEIVAGIAIFTAGYLFQSFMVPLNSILIGNERVDIVSILELLMQVMFWVLAGVVLFMRLDFKWLLVAALVNLPLNMLFQLWIFRRNRIRVPPFKLNRETWWSLLKAGFPFALIQISLSFAFRFDTVILSGRVSDQQVGWYKSAYNLILTFTTLARTFSSAAMPSLAREHAINPDAIRPWYYRSVKIILFFALPMAIGGMVLADKIVITLYDYEFLPAAIALAILVWDLPFVMFDSLCGNLSASMQRERNSARIYGSLGVVNVALNLILTPLFGIIGASFATVLTDVTGSAQFYAFFRRELGPGLGFRHLVRLIGCAGLMGALVYLMRDSNLLVVVSVGGIFYVPLVWFSGALTPEEHSQFAAVARKLVDIVSHSMTRPGSIT